MKLELKKKEKAIPLGGNIQIDLMPQSYRDVVELRDLRRKWIVGLIAVAIISVVASLSFYAKSVVVNSQLNSEQSTHQQLDSQIANYAEVNQALDSQAEAKKLLEKGASTELNWDKLFKTIQDNLPNGTEITSLSAVVGGDKNSEVISGVLLNLSSNDDIQYADTLKAMQGVGSIDSVEIGPIALTGENRYNFQITFTFDKSVLTGSYVEIPKEKK